MSNKKIQTHHHYSESILSTFYQELHIIIPIIGSNSETNKIDSKSLKLI